MKKLNTKGFGAIEAILIVVIVGLIGGVGWYVYSQRKPAQNDSKTQQNENDNNTSTELTTSQTEPEPECAVITPSGWTTKSDQASGINYAVDKSWPDETAVSVYNVGEDIPVGFGSPVTIRYNATAKSWEVHGSNIEEPNSLVKETSTKVPGSSATATYQTGDGGSGQNRILFVKGTKVYQIALPTEMNCQTSPYEASIDYVINSVKTN